MKQEPTVQCRGCGNEKNPTRKEIEHRQTLQTPLKLDGAITANKVKAKEKHLLSLTIDSADTEIKVTAEKRENGIQNSKQNTDYRAARTGNNPASLQQ